MEITKVQLDDVKKMYGYTTGGVMLKGLKLIGSALLTTFLVSLLTAVLVKVLWNALLPGLLHTPHISYFQAVGVMFLSSLLFKNCSTK